MDDHIAGVDQHPVAVRQAFDARAAAALVFQGAQKVVGQRADVALRAAGRDDDRVGDRAPVLQINADDVLGLVFVQAFQDQAFQRAEVRLGLGRGLGGGRGLMRTRRGVATQR